MDPSPAVTRAGLVEDLGRRLGAWKIDPRIAFLSADRELRTPFARTLQVLESAPWHERNFARKLRELGIGAADIRRRGLAGDVEQIHRRLGLRGPGRATIVITRVSGRPGPDLRRPRTVDCAGHREPWIVCSPSAAGGAPSSTLTAERTEEVRSRVRLLIDITARAGSYRKGLLTAAGRLGPEEAAIISDLEVRGLQVPQLKDLLCGGHVLVDDPQLYEDWRFAKVSHLRISSHHRDIDKTRYPDIGMRGHVVREKLHGRTAHGNLGAAGEDSGRLRRAQAAQPG